MIQTTLDRALEAFAAVNAIRSMVKGMDALHVFHLKNRLKESVDFLIEEEGKLIDENGGTITDTGMVIFPNPEKKTKFNKARKELGGMPAEVDAEPVVIRIEKCQEVTAEQIEALDGFVIFEEEVKQNGDK